jgi:DNA-binding PadR family transcriptional regulator
MAFGFGRHFEHKHGFGHAHGHEFFYARRGGGRGPFGRGNPFEWAEGQEHFGRHGGGGRFFRRGDIKFALLNLLTERPMHGYEMMKALETQSGGMYTPSAGTIYPTLQLLEDRGFVTSTESEGKKVYRITEAGRAELASQKQGGFGPGDFGGFGFGREDFRHSPEVHALKGEAKELAHLVLRAISLVVHNPSKLPQFRAILQQTRQALQDMINSPEVPASKAASGDSPGSKESAPPQEL